jgi:peptidoglycan/LPS O-acetylase OafA/YrhL
MTEKSQPVDVLTKRDSTLSRRLDGLDALRGIAILAVLVYHCILEFNIGGDGWLGTVSSNPYNFFFPHHLGNFGVSLFFVISGFCIHRSNQLWVSRNPQASISAQWKEYARRRFFRIAPLYFLVLIAFYIAFSPAPFSSAELIDLAVHAAFIQTLLEGHLTHINPSFWTLAVEVQLYCLYPLLWLSIRRWGAIRVLSATLLLSLAWRLGLPLLVRTNWVIYLPWRWAFEWLLGVGVAQAIESRRWPHARHIAGALVIALMLLVPSRSPLLYAVVPGIVFSMLVGRMARLSKIPAVLSPLVSLGVSSYALYLIHQPIMAMVARYLQSVGISTVDPLPFAAASLACCAACMAVSPGLERLGRVLGQCRSRKVG